MKVIFDTSVVISAVLKDRVPEEVILFVLGNPDFTWIASTEIVNEYMSVIKRGKFKLSEETVQKWRSIFERRVKVEEATLEVDFPRDQKDAIFLACALSVKADYLITGDKDFEEAHKAGVTTVIKVSEFKRLIVENW
ncbi:MAG: putative toxin-antitoxin system toxin component, PIN family [Anaerolineales bacterium]|nr:putative toxin-antitoxin system toxin component, PIN family [Anaerolineales bacterium]